MNGFSATVSHNTESGDSGGGVEWGVKEFLSVGLKLIFNFGENIEESKTKMNNANAQLDEAMIDIEFLKDE